MASSSDNNTTSTKEECHPFQLIDADGKFNGGELDDFLDKVNLSASGVSYVVAAIVGPQSSGKSTLLNHLFCTDFKAMNAAEGKKQITQGIWMANCTGIDPHTLIMDVEGNDGQERGEVDTKFERQSALFALVVSNMVIINMWYSDVGREQGANKPLLRMVFQAMVTMFKTNKVTLMFVIRDANQQTPFSFLEAQVKKAVQEIWEPIAPEKAPLSNFFNVLVVPLPHLLFQRDQFVEEVANLRKQFFNSMSPGGLASGKESLIPASGFSCSAMSLWETIRENKDLDIPSHKVLVATMFCAKIADEKFTWFFKNEVWIDIQKSVHDRENFEGFGDKVNSLLDTCLNEYHERTKYYDDNVRESKQMVLKARLLKAIQPVWNSVMDHIVSTTLEMFKNELDEAVKNGVDPSEASPVCSDSLNVRFDEGCTDAEIELAKWDVSIIKAKLLSRVVHHVTFVTTEVAQLKAEKEAAKLKLEHDKELAASQEASRVLAVEHEEKERQLKHEMELVAAQQAAIVAVERDATERQLEHERELVEAQQATIVAAERLATERQLKHERDLVAIQEAAKVAAEHEATERQLKHERELVVAKEAVELEAEHAMAVSQLKAEKDAIEQEGKHKLELAALKAEHDAAETKREHEAKVADIKREQERERERNDRERDRQGGLLSQLFR